MSAFCALHPDGTLACSCGYVAREVETEYGRCDKWSQDRMSGEWSFCSPAEKATYADALAKYKALWQESEPLEAARYAMTRVLAMRRRGGAMSEAA